MNLALNTEMLPYEVLDNPPCLSYRGSCLSGHSIFLHCFGGEEAHPVHQRRLFRVFRLLHLKYMDLCNCSNDTSNPLNPLDFRAKCLLTALPK
jgi:hypothetical protein